MHLFGHLSIIIYRMNAITATPVCLFHLFFPKLLVILYYKGVTLYMLDFIQSADTEIILFIQNNIRVPFIDAIMIFMSYLGEAGIVWVAISLILIFRKKYRMAGICTLAAMALCYVLNDLILKEIVHRPRPFDTITQLTALGFKPSSWSFPSGHACSSFVAALTLTKFLGKKGSLSYILAVLIAVSRPYAGVHYVSDIIAGAIFGTLCALIIFEILRRTGLMARLERRFLR